MRSSHIAVQTYATDCSLGCYSADLLKRCGLPCLSNVDKRESFLLRHPETVFQSCVNRHAQRLFLFQTVATIGNENCSKKVVEINSDGFTD